MGALFGSGARNRSFRLALILPVRRSDGSLHYMERNFDRNGQHWLTVALRGVKNLKSANTAIVEVKAGALYQKKIYRGAPLYFAMRGYAEADTVRITWPNGLIQNEPQKKTDASLSIEEAQRLVGFVPDDLHLERTWISVHHGRVRGGSARGKFCGWEVFPG